MSLVCNNNCDISDGYDVCSGCGEVKIPKDLMPQIIMAINGSQKWRYNEYLTNEFSETDVVKNDNEFALIETTKYAQFIFVKSSNPHNLCLTLWNDKVLNRYLGQTYLVEFAILDINSISHHPSLSNKDIKMLKIIGCQECIAMLAPLIPKHIELSPSQKKCSHVLYIKKLYKKYYIGVFDKNHCYGDLIEKLKHSETEISREYNKLREVFLRDNICLNGNALDLSINHNEWNQCLIDMGAKHVVCPTNNEYLEYLYCTNCLQSGHISSKCDDRDKICVVGDSHTALWISGERFYINTDVVRIRIPGMSAQGLINKESHLQSSKKIISAFTNCHNGNSQYLFIQIGQVDIDYIWYFSQMKYKNTLTFDDQIEKSVNNLFIFLNDNLLNKKQNLKIIINGIHPPPLNNKNMRDILYQHFINRGDLTKEYLDKHLVLPSHQGRTQMALQFNKRLKDKCKQYESKCFFVEVASEIIDENTGIVNQKYVQQREIDIHLDFNELMPIYHKKVKQLNIEFALKIDSVRNKLKRFKNELNKTYDGDKFDMIVCDKNMTPSNAVSIMNCLSHHLNDNGYIIFTLKTTDRNKSKKEIKSDMSYYINVLSESFENIQIRHLFTDKSKQRTLTANKKKKSVLIVM